MEFLKLQVSEQRGIIDELTQVQNLMIFFGKAFLIPFYNALSRTEPQYVSSTL